MNKLNNIVKIRITAGPPYSMCSIEIPSGPGFLPVFTFLRHSMTSVSEIFPNPSVCLGNLMSSAFPTLLSNSSKCLFQILQMQRPSRYNVLTLIFFRTSFQNSYRITYQLKFPYFIFIRFYKIDCAFQVRWVDLISSNKAEPGDPLSNQPSIGFDGISMSLIRLLLLGSAARK